MPLDAICLRALTNELKGQLLGARIDKVQQPARDQIVLLLRGNLRLLLNAGPNQPRVQLTEVLRENPAEPPMLCMLLRKHLVGGRITEIEQSGLERIVTFTVRSVNELGESGTKKLVLWSREAGAWGEGPPLEPPAARRGRPHFGLYAPCGV